MKFLSLCLLLATTASVLAEVRVREFKSARGGRVWIYKPDAKPTEKLPCVLIAAAGSNLVTGMLLSEEDRPEHQPYAEAGFVVAAYDVSGPPPEDESDEEKLLESLKAYFKSDFGTADAMAALDLAQEKVTQIDPRRIYVAGHSSAGTLALQVAAAFGQIQGAAVYAPVVDLEEQIGKQQIESINGEVMGFRRILGYSPKNHWDIQQSPLFLFHAKDDRKPWVEAIEKFHLALEKAKAPHEYVVVDSGGHYDSMIEVGLPRGVEWLKKLDATVAASKPRPGTQPLDVSPGMEIEFKDNGIHLDKFLFLPGKTTRAELVAALGEPDRSVRVFLFGSDTVMLYYDAAGLEFTFKSAVQQDTLLPRRESPLELLIHFRPSGNYSPRKAFPGKVVIRGVEIRAGVTEGKVAADLKPKFTKEEAAIGNNSSSIRRFAKSYTTFSGGKAGELKDDPVDYIFCARPMPE